MYDFNDNLLPTRKSLLSGENCNQLFSTPIQFAFAILSEIDDKTSIYFTDYLVVVCRNQIRVYSGGALSLRNKMRNFRRSEARSTKLWIYTR